MNKVVKRIVSFLCIIAAILIVTGLALTLKDLMATEDLYNVADDQGYYKVVFNLNGASMIEHKSVRCKINGDSCTVTLPNATRDGGVVLGYSENKNDLEEMYKVGETITLKDNITLYAISYKKLILSIDKRDVDYLEKEELSCEIYNEAKTCKVKIPKYNKNGYENKGYSTNQESLTGFIYPSEDYELSRNTTIYPIYGTSSRHRVLSISKTFTYRDSFIEVEKGCSEKVYKEFLKYLDGISAKAPFLLLGNKITFVTNETFDAVWGVTYVGMNYGPKSLRSVDIRCDGNSYNDYYATMVHEMAHSWDFYYATKFGDNISSQSDVINLYEKYLKDRNRPFREYSYSNIYEFMADMMRYYYFKYYVPRDPFSMYSYPSDIRKSLEKYICISKNNYDESKCS